MGDTFDAYVLEEQGPAVLRQLSERDLPDAEVTVDVSQQGQSESAIVWVSKDGRFIFRG